MASKQQNIQGKVDAAQWIATNGYPKAGMFADKKSLQKFYKQLPIETIEAWAYENNVQYKTCEVSEPIHRMRVCMAILVSYFPPEKATKQESPYKVYSTEELVSMAIDNNVAFEVADDDRINRMRVIMALRANKVIG